MFLLQCSFVAFFTRFELISNTKVFFIDRCCCGQGFGIMVVENNGGGVRG
jgi:hypothetical protein